MMVGVAGKSRACHDCKRRRVKCDFGKPSCLRCQKAGFICQGYGRASTFVNRTLSKPSTTALTAISEAKVHEIQYARNPPSSLYQVFQRLRLSISNLSSSPVSFRSQAWDLLKDLYLPQGLPTDDINLEITTPFSWLHAVCHMSQESSALDKSLLAFCAIQIYVAEPSSISVDLALQLYSEALPELVKNLEHAHDRNKDESLAAIVVLSTCELFVLPNDQGWRAHGHGISELLRHRTSFNARSLVWLRLCSRLRVICVIIGLIKHQRLALDPHTWRQFMPIDTVSEFSFEALMNILSEIPFLLEESDRVIKSKATCPKLLETLLAVFQKIFAWQQAYRRSLNKPPYWAVPSRLRNPADDGYANKLFPFALEFQNLNVAILIVFSSGVMLQLLSAALLHEREISFLYESGSRQPKIQPDAPEPHKWSTQSIKWEADRLARFLCQSMEFFFRQEMGTVGAQSTCHPQCVTRNYFRQVGLQRELEWCGNIKNMDGPGYRRGIELMLFEAEGDG